MDSGAPPPPPPGSSRDAVRAVVRLTGWGGTKGTETSGHVPDPVQTPERQHAQRKGSKCMYKCST